MLFNRYFFHPVCLFGPTRLLIFANPPPHIFQGLDLKNPNFQSHFEPDLNRDWLILQGLDPKNARALQGLEPKKPELWVKSTMQVDLKLGLEVPTLVATALLPAMQNWEEIYQKSPIQMTTFASGAMHPT